MDRTIFHVDNSSLEALSASEAVVAFRDLLWAEATSLGIARNLINIPSAINASDGGVDGGLIANHLSESWWGSSVTHYLQKKEGVITLKNTEKNENVRRWLEDYVDELNEKIELFKIAEERDDFHNPPV